MKKILSWLMVIMLIFTPVIVNAAKSETKKDPIKIHIFYRTTCPYCQKLHAYLDELEEDKKINYMFEVVDYEVSSNEENYNLMDLVGEYFNYEISGVPFYVIGEKYFTGFSDENSPSQIEAAIKSAYNDDDYVDVVQPIVESGEVVQPIVESGEVANVSSITKESDSKEKQNDVTNYIILGITAIIVIAIIFARSNNTYYDDSSDEDEEKEKEKEKNKSEEKQKDEVSKEEKKEVKKTTSKNANKSSSKKTAKKTTKTKKK